MSVWVLQTKAGNIILWNRDTAGKWIEYFLFVLMEEDTENLPQNTGLPVWDG